MEAIKEKIGLPKSIKIWGHQYTVKKKKDPKYYDGKQSHIVLGLFSAESQEILLSSNEIRTGSKEVETFIHEILHGICYSSNVFGNMENKRDHEEHVVDTLANGLALVFKDNPDLLDYIKETLHGEKDTTIH